MFRNAVWFGALLLLAGTAVLVTPGLGQARPGGGRGGGHFGGGHFGGGHFGGGHFGGGHFGGGHFGGFRGGHFGGFRGGHFGGFRGFRGGYLYRPYYHNYGYYRRNYYPRYYGYYPYYYNSYPYYSGSSGYDSGYDGSYYQPELPSDAYPGSERSSAYPPAEADTTAHVTVKVPADARLWVDGKPTTSTGTVRQFISPALTPGRRYAYDLRARWKEHGREVTQTRQVVVTAGADVRVDFPLPPGTAGRDGSTRDR
jgi:uncharacterized protein (TIGR03000 family)